MLKRLLFATCILIMCVATKSFSQQSLSCLDCENGSVSEEELCGDAVNDVCLAAFPINCGQTYCGQVYTDGTVDEDWYVFFMDSTVDVTLYYNSKEALSVEVYVDCFADPVISATSTACNFDSLTGTLLSGVYYLRITPFNGIMTCDSLAFYNFKLQCGPATPCDLDVAIAATAGCPGTASGTVEAIAINGQGPYFYLWDNGSTDQMQLDLPDGTYALTVVDNTGCADTASATLTGVCSIPSSVAVSDITFFKATVSWIPSDCAQKYRVQIRPQGTLTWTTYFVNGVFSSKVVQFLQAGTTYQVRVRTQCSPNGVTLSPWSPIITFTTPGACTAPSNISASPSSTSSIITWNPGTGVYAYRLRYRVQGSGTWTPVWINGNLTIKNITGLTANTTYEYQMRSQCNPQANDFSPYTSIQTFTTQMRLGEIENDLVGLYPNPNNGSFALSFASNTRESLHLSVYDILGREVFHQVVYALNGNNTVNLNMDLAEGQYFLKLEGNTLNKVLLFNVSK